MWFSFLKSIEKLMKAKMNELEKNFVKGIVTMRNQLFCYNILIGSRKKI